MNAKDRPRVDVDEEMLRNAMLDVPAMRNRSSAYTTPPKVEAEQTKSAEPEPPKRVPYRRSKRDEGERSYAEIFLINDGECSRVSTYVNRDTHEKIKRLLSAASPGVSIVSYINNILSHHLEQYENEITKLYRNGMDKPF